MSIGPLSRPPLPYQLSMWIRVAGRYGEGGLVELHCNPHPSVHLVLPKMEWAVFAILAQTAVNWPPGSTLAFQTSKSLAELMRSVLADNQVRAQNVIRTISRLRARFNDTGLAEYFAKVDVIESKADFGKTMLEHDAKLGYRISIAPPRGYKLDIRPRGN